MAVFSRRLITGKECIKEKHPHSKAGICICTTLCDDAGSQISCGSLPRFTKIPIMEGVTEIP